MTEVDFAIAIGMTIAIISFIIFYAADDFNQDISMIRSNELDHAKFSISNKLLRDYLVDDVSKISVMFENLQDSSNSQSLDISIQPDDFSDEIYLYDNEFNKICHYETTAQEIWKQTNGELDYFVAAIGTSGTLMGVGTYLKKYKPTVKVVSADPVAGPPCCLR